MLRVVLRTSIRRLGPQTVSNLPKTFRCATLTPFRLSPFSTAPHSDEPEAVNPIENMPEPEFHGIADKLLEDLEGTLEEQLEDVAEDLDIMYAQGVLTVSLGPSQGTYVLNKQTPNRQIWWSSPHSGPKRFNYDPTKKVWVGSRDGIELKQRLKEEMQNAYEIELEL